LGTFRIEVRRSWGGDVLPLKSLATLPEGAHLVWAPVHLPLSQAASAEVTAILVPASGDDLVILDPHPANTRVEWQLAASPAAIAVVFGPQGLSMGKVRSLVTRNREVVEQIADYAAETSKVESLVQELADAEQSGSGVDAALKGFSARYGVATPKLDASAPTNQQASVLLRTVLPTAGSYDPLATQSAQVQQSGGLAASVAGLFFGGSAVGLATGGAALVEGLKGAVFPGTEFRTAFAQNGEGDSLALCTKSQARKARTHIAYLWAYRVPNSKPPDLSVAGPAYLPLGSPSTIGLKAAKDSSAKQLDHARDWRIVPVAGGAAAPVAVHLASDSIELDLAHAKAQPGDYKLTAMWDWDPIAIDGILHLRKIPDFSHVQLAPESREKLMEGAGIVTVKLTGADFEFLEKAAVSKVSPHPPAPTETRFALPLGKRAGDQQNVTVDIDAAARGAYLLSLTQSGGATDKVPFTILPPNPAISGLPVRVNLDDAAQPLRFEGSGLDRIESVTSEAGEIRGAALASGWAGSIRLRAGARVGDVFAISLKVKDVAAPVAVPSAIKVSGPRPSITDVKKSVSTAFGLTLRPDELPAGTVVGMVLTFRRFEDGSFDAGVVRPHVDLGCKSGGLRKALSLSPDDHVPGVDLTAASPGMLFLSVDPGLIGYPGCLLAASIDIEPEGLSDAFAIGRVIRVPQLEQFTLSNEQLGQSIYAGTLKGRDLDVIEKTGWDADNGVRVDSVPEPVPGDKSSLETIRVGLPWPAPSPHAPLYVWFRGEGKGRKTSLTY
jgi:hypothetical protein